MPETLMSTLVDIRLATLTALRNAENRDEHNKLLIAISVPKLVFCALCTLFALTVILYAVPFHTMKNAI